MTTALFLQIVVVASNLIIFVFVGFYLWRLNKDSSKLESKAKDLSKKEEEITAQYRQMVDQIHKKEAEVLENATQQAKIIINNSHKISDSSKESIDNALKKMVADIQDQASKSSIDHVNNYKNYLNQISEKSLTNFQGITQKFESEMQTQMQEFRKSLLPGIQNELEEYKSQQLRTAEEKIEKIVQQVAQEVFNRSLTTEEHKQLIIRSLERSKKEGVFD